MNKEDKEKGIKFIDMIGKKVLFTDSFEEEPISGYLMSIDFSEDDVLYGDYYSNNRYYMAFIDRKEYLVAKKEYLAAKEEYLLKQIEELETISK